MDTDRDLLLRSRSGDAQALGTILQRHLPALRAFVHLRLGSVPKARESDSDVVQSVCLELLRAQPGFEYRGEGQFRHWLYAAALHKIRQLAKHHGAARRDVRREQNVEASGSSDEQMLACFATFSTPSRDAAAHEEIARIEAAFAQLPEHYREVISLARIVGLSQEELAEAMARSVPSVRNLLNRALVRLAALLDGGA